MIKSRSNTRRTNGIAIVEFAVGLSILFPIALLMVYLVWEACQYVFINNCLCEAARTAARSCAIAYGAQPSGSAGSPDAQGPNVAPPQPTYVYSAPSSLIVEGSSASSFSTPPKSANDAFTQVRIGNVVTDNSQFLAVYSPAAPNNQDPSLSIGRVTVAVTYKGKFPSPDPLNLAASLAKVKLSQSCSYPLEF